MKFTIVKSAVFSQIQRIFVEILGDPEILVYTHQTNHANYLYISIFGRMEYFHLGAILSK